VKRPFRFTPIEEAGRRVLAGLGQEGNALPLVQAQWAGVVGSYLARRTEPTSLHSGCLAVRLLDPASRRTVRGLLPEIERKVRQALPAVRSIRLE
jgi:Dna[CI] antecedent DciA-like protein